MLYSRLFIVSAVFLAGSAVVSVAQEPAPPATVSPEAAEFFEKHVRPVFVENCFPCHGRKMQQAGFRMDSIQSMLKGTDTKHVVLVPGQPENSGLIHAIRQDGAVKMPPGRKLSAKDIDNITTWVKMGAPWPESAKLPDQDNLSTKKAHWAFQPVRKPALPAVKNKDWVKSPIDHFILAALARKKMTPARPADRRTLLRRVSFDLIGLPPTQEEITAFEKDSSPNAFAKVVDRLLASPRYGERWGRFWLDLARYSDTKGYVFVEDRNYPFAYTYRDWVIRALNEDMPYDQFVINQLAADHLVPKETDRVPLAEKDRAKRSLAAMGFLTVGRRFLNSQPDIIDDRIDVVTRSTMALTVACARCHDHKFDPIPTKDYYSLYGVFASSNEPKDLPVIAAHARVEAWETYQRELKARDEAVKKFEEAKKEELKAKQEAAMKELTMLQKRVAEWKKSPPPAPERAMALEDLPTPVNPRVFIRGNPGRPGDEVPRQFLQILSGEKREPFKKGSGRLEFAQAIASKDNPLTARVMVNRVWINHFGAGLVRTPSDFGIRSDPPSHPELLDYLASRFMEDGWSLKKLHRLILLSSAYQQSSEDNPGYRRMDPDNLLVWRMNRRRLDFEATRDSLLAASGQLELKMGGPSVEMTTPPFTTRRTVYGFVERQNLPGIFRTFDFAGPDTHSPQRFTTTVPQQALFLMNSPFVIQQATALVSSKDVEKQSDAATRIQELYRRVYGRSATPEEVALGERFLKMAAEPAKPEAMAANPWQYGYGEYDDAAGKLKSFTPMPHWAGDFWQGGKDFPDPKFSFLRITRTGGHVGPDLQHAAIKRWVAPRNAVVSIMGEIRHISKEGDGVQARITSSRLGELGKWVAQGSQAETSVARVEVYKGDIIDFVVDCRKEHSFDSFTWAPVIRVIDGAATRLAANDGENEVTEWNANSDFHGPLTKPPKPQTPWEKYAQVLLMTNEFVFVD